VSSVEHERKQYKDLFNLQKIYEIKLNFESMGKSIFIVFIFCLLFAASHAQARWSFELHGGQVYNVPLPLQIKQESYPDIKLTARYFTEPLTLPVYWDLRFSRWQNNKSWEFEAIHHKLYLDNTTPEVQKFNISHGFNMLIVNRGIEKKSFRYRAGVGVVLAHPESIIRGKEFGNSTDDLDTGYYLTGPVFNLAISRPIRLGGRFYLNPEAKTTFAYSYIKISEGHANVYNLAFHLILGFGVDFIHPNRK
jgi:hypothetical protein